MEHPTHFADRVRRIVLDPRTEWPRIAKEQASVEAIFTGWVMILAAIGPIALLISRRSIRLAVAEYILWLIITFVLAQAVDALSPSFGGKRDFIASLKLTAYSLTTAWIAGIFGLLGAPGIVLWLIAMAYAFYTFFLGAPVLKRAAPDRALPFTLVVVLCAFVLGYLANVVIGGMLGVPRGAASMGAEAARAQPVAQRRAQEAACDGARARCLPDL